MTEYPQARSEQLVIRQLADETIVYDTRVHSAACLNELAQKVWALCDGNRDLDDIVDACDGANAAIVSQALSKLSKADLLEVPFEAASGTSRRGMMGQMAGAGLAAAVTVMTVPTAVMNRPGFTGGCLV